MEFKRVTETLCVLTMAFLVAAVTTKSTSRENMKDRIGITGIDILRNQMNIRRIKATFNFKEV